jgi:outer membrane receptor protein involved in Fe transport
MMCSRWLARLSAVLVVVVLVVAGLIPVSAGAARAQEMGHGYRERGPRFLLEATPAPIRIDVARTPMLRRRISLDVRGQSLGDALRAVERASGVRLAFSKWSVPTDRVVQLHADNLTVAAALTELLIDADVDVLFSRDGRAALVRRSEVEKMELRATGTVSGRVTDAKTHEPVVGASIAVEGTQHGATTGESGQYVIQNVPAGTYTVTARRIGYAKAAQAVIVPDGGTVTLSFALARAATALDRVVVTGTVIPTEVKALPNPISVISASVIANQQPRTLGEILREAVPGMVAWDSPTFPENTSFSVRGAASLGGSSVKVYVDGVEIASRSNAAIDPTSIERIEVIRGPQAATLYGSDAIGGVVQIFTKRGDTTTTRPHIEARAAWGALQSEYEGFEATLRQEYSAAVRGAGSNYSYNLGGSYTRLGNWIPEGAQSLPSLYGGVQIAQGRFTLDLSARSNQQDIKQAYSPVAATTGYSLYVKPLHTDISAKEQSIGSRAAWQTTGWLRQNVTIGVDRYLSSSQQYEPQLRTPGDTLLRLGDYTVSKASVAYNASVSGAIRQDLVGNLTVGVDHYSEETMSYSTSGAVNTTGAVITDPLLPVTATRDNVTNTGYFAQLQATFRSRLTLTTGVRAERNSSIGANVGAPVLPRVGLAYALDVGGTTIKLRSSYGEAILPPSPLQAQGRPLGAGSLLLANPDLKPERQRGWDAGVDIAFGSLASASLTYYDQTARDLIQLVIVKPPFREYQSQNAGSIRNKGVEFEGTLVAGPARITGQFAATDSRMVALSPLYTGDLRVGEHPFVMPTYTAGAALALVPWQSTTVTAGVKYVGSVRNYDSFAQLSCAAGTGPCLPTPRDYLITYPGFTKVDIAVTQRLTTWSSGFISVRNIGNNSAAEKNNVNVPTMGRITMVGMKLSY